MTLALLLRDAIDQFSDGFDFVRVNVVSFEQFEHDRMSRTVKHAFNKIIQQAAPDALSFDLGSELKRPAPFLAFQITLADHDVHQRDHRAVSQFAIVIGQSLPNFIHRFR